MSELGFSPANKFAADHVEFYKDYVDIEGRFARARVFFDKPVMGMQGMRLANFVVNIQKTIAPDLDAVEREAPSIIQQDLSEALEAFHELTGIPAQSVQTRECVQCHEHKADFFIVNGDAICKDCVDQRKAAP
jgi:hypothetical protein